MKRKIKLTSALKKALPKKNRGYILSEDLGAWMNNSNTATMTPEEERLQDLIVRILFNKTGKYGPYQHALYARRFKNFILKIVPLDAIRGTADAMFTAMVDMEHSTIYISEGFLIDESKLYQLNVIIRHEMAHTLLRHHLRSAALLGERA